MKRSCSTTGSWRCCLSMEVVSSIPAGSTIIYRSFVGLYAFPCARASKLNQQICTWHISLDYYQGHLPTHRLMVHPVQSHGTLQYSCGLLWSLRTASRGPPCSAPVAGCGLSGQPAEGRPVVLLWPAVVSRDSQQRVAL